MLKKFTTTCLAGAAIVGIGAYLLAQSRTQPTEASRASRLLAMQEPASQAKPRGTPLASVSWIGVMLEDHEGVRVKAIFPAGPAAFSGVRVGDVLLKVDTTNVDSTNAAEVAIERLVPGQAIALTIRRHGKTVELKVTPDSLEEFRKRYTGEMLRRDPRDPRYGQHHGVSEADLQVEVVRRLFEQHERLETTLLELKSEIQALRKEVRALQK
jgi:predicted metalloprotease with PDZ domain